MSTGASRAGTPTRRRGRSAAAILERVLWAVVVLGALALLLRGLAAGVYFEPTAEALAEARTGRLQVACGCCVLAAAAWYAVRVSGRPRWVAAGLLSPVVLCGGLSLVAAGSLFPQLAVLVAYPAAMAGAIGGLLVKRR